jgi:septal ring factor EnvC (AmiA/AmiB activator)
MVSWNRLDMDIETAGAIEQVHARIDAVEQSLRTEIRRESASVRSELASIRSELASTRSELGDEIRESLAEAKRHAQVLNESVRDDIRMLAEVVAAMSTKRDSHAP